SGPGSLNLLSGLGSAWGNNLAVVVITPGAPSHLAYPHAGMAMDVDNQSLFAPLTKWNAVVRDPARIPSLVVQAVREAVTGRPGPVHLEIPVDVLSSELEIELPEITPVVAPRPLADPGEVDRAAALLTSASRPLLIAGGGVAVSDASSEFRAVAAR